MPHAPIASAVPDLVVVGNLIVDDLVFDDGTTRMGEPGGAVIYAALGASLWPVSVGIVSVAGTDYPAGPLAALEARGISLHGIRRLPTEGLRVWLLYEPVARRLVHRLGRPSHEDGSPGPADVPGGWREARAFHLTPAPLHAQALLVRELSATTRAQVSLDPHTPVTDDRLDAWRSTLAGVDVFFVSDEELQLAARGAGHATAPAAKDADSGHETRTGSWDDAASLAAAIDALREGRLEAVLVKRGSRGGRLFGRDVPPVDWPARVATVVDPTGAGDAFAGGFMAARLHGAAPARALAQGVVSASFAMEAWGAEGLFSATPQAAARRLQEWFPDIR